MKRKAGVPSANANDNPALGRCQECHVIIFHQDILHGDTQVISIGTAHCLPVFQCPSKHLDTCNECAVVNSADKLDCADCWAQFWPTDVGDGDVDPVVAFRKQDSTAKCASN